MTNEDNTIRYHGDPQPQTDFYLGRGNTAHYLGTTILTHEQIGLDLLRSLGENDYNEAHYLRSVAAMTGNRDLQRHASSTSSHDTTAPALADVLAEVEWPHDHADSTETPWAYCYDKGTVYAYHFGVEMLQIRCNTHRWTGRNPETRVRESRPVNDFPAMRES